MKVKLAMMWVVSFATRILSAQGGIATESMKPLSDEARELQARIDALAAADGFYELAPVEWTDSHFTKQASDAGFVK